MPSICFWMIPLFGAFIGVCVAFICRGQLRFQVKSILEFSQHDDHKEVQEKIKLIIAEHLDLLVALFKSKIPLASTFLGQAKEEKLKAEACEELFKAVPSISGLVSGSSIVVQFTDKLWRSMTYSLMLMGAATGALLGFIEMLLQMGLMMIMC